MRWRAESLVFVLAAAGSFSALALTGWTPAGRAGAAEGGSSVRSLEAHARAAMESGDQAAAKGDLSGADKQYRVAWRHEAVRREAAMALRGLHANRAYTLPVDEESVGATASLLGEEFRRFETDHFVILSDAGRDWTINKARILERAHHQFFRVVDRMEYPAIPASQKLQCVLFGDHAMYRAFASAHDGVTAPWIAGYYAGKSNRVVFYNDTTGPAFVEAFEQLAEYEQSVLDLRSQARKAGRARDRSLAEDLNMRADALSRQVAGERVRLLGEAAGASEAKTIHEAIHLLAYNTGVQSRSHQYPFWITEGFATAFETDRPYAAFGPDHPSPERESTFRESREAGESVDLETFVMLDRPLDADAQAADVMYSEAYALVTHLYRTNRRGLAQFLEDVAAEPAGSISPERQLALFRGRFGDPVGLERRWLDRARR